MYFAEETVRKGARKVLSQEERDHIGYMFLVKLLREDKEDMKYFCGPRRKKAVPTIATLAETTDEKAALFLDALARSFEELGAKK